MPSHNLPTIPEIVSDLCTVITTVTGGAGCLALLGSKAERITEHVPEIILTKVSTGSFAVAGLSAAVGAYARHKEMVL
jgi:hypothetical protein